MLDSPKARDLFYRFPKSFETIFSETSSEPMIQNYEIFVLTTKGFGNNCTIDFPFVY
jgi:hypothetical protein